MANDTFSISVIVPTYNRCQQLEYTLTSLLSQTIDKSDYEVVIVDDGSSDNTFQMIKTFESTINFKYAYQSDKGYRPASARNMGIRVANGKICMFIDSGIILKTDCLKRHLDCHKSRGREVAIIGYTYGWGADEEVLTKAIDPFDADGSIARLVEMGTVRDIRDNIFRKYNDKIEGLAVPWTLFYGGHVSVRKTSLFEVGLFDENYDGRWGAEDQDLGYRLHKANKQIVLCRQAAVVHLPLSAESSARAQEGYENCRYFNKKFHTVESQVFLDYYAQDISRQITNNEVLDFHEVITNANIEHTL